MQGIPEQPEPQVRPPQQQQPEGTAPAPAAAQPAALGDEGFNMFEAAAQAGEGGGRRGGAGAGGGAGGGDALANLDFLRSNPHFQQLRQLVQQQPQMLEPILQQVAAGNPHIAQLIGQNSEQFLQLLSEDLGEEEEGALPPGTQAISVTEEERDAIERVSSLPLPQSFHLLTRTALPSGLPPGFSHPGVLRLRQERRAGSQFPLRPAGRRRGVNDSLSIYALMNTKHAAVDRRLNFSLLLFPTSLPIPLAAVRCSCWTSHLYQRLSCT